MKVRSSAFADLDLGIFMKMRSVRPAGMSAIEFFEQTLLTHPECQFHGS